MQNSKNIPDLRGKWNTTGKIFTRNSRDQELNFDTIVSISFPQEIEQQEHFIIVKEPTGNRIGVLNYFNRTWQLTIADDDDNGTAVLFPKCPGNFNVWVGSYRESGFDNRPEQAQVVGRFEMKRN